MRKGKVKSKSNAIPDQSPIKTSPRGPPPTPLLGERLKIVLQAIEQSWGLLTNY